MTEETKTLPFADDDQVQITAICRPDDYLPALQLFTVTAKDGQGVRLGKLEALRWAEPGFDPTDTTWLLWAFDHYSQLSYDLASEVRRSRRAIAQRHGEKGPAAGFIGLLELYIEPAARGQRFGFELVRHLKELHAGMIWYAGLLAGPLDARVSRRQFREIRRKLIAYYASDADLGFEQDAPRSCPALMTACWDQEEVGMIASVG